MTTGDSNGGNANASGTVAAAAAAAVVVATSSVSKGADTRSVGVQSSLGDRLSSVNVDDIAQLIGEVADKVLKFVSDCMPGLEAWTLGTLDTIFAPRLVLRHLIVAMALQTGLLTWNGLVSVANKLLSRMSKSHRDVKRCRQGMRMAKDYEEWKMWAERLDELEGHDTWRKRPDSLLFNHKILQQQISELSAMINSEDVFGLMFRLRGSLSRNQHGMLHEGLFTRAHAGTKVIVERYHEVVCEALHYICAKNAVAQDIPTDAKLAFFNETRHAYGRTALMLSGGAAMGIYHAGVVKALLERNLLPRVISGASAGSIVAAMVGTRTDAELVPMFAGESILLSFFRPLRDSERKLTGGGKFNNEAFWQLLVPPGLRWLGEVFWDLILHSDGFLKMDTDYFRTILRHNVGPSTFQEAFDRTGRIVNITVAPRNRTDPPRLLNYLTAPHVLVWSAAVCSSSVPGVFEPSKLLVKDADGSTNPEYGSTEKFVDGSMEADLPMQQISELFNINHFIVSQVNPHASLLSTMSLPKSVWNPPLYRILVGLVGFMQAQARNWIRNVIEFVSLRRMAPVWASKRGGIQLLTQEYEGRHCDVTITPWEGHESILSSFMKMLCNVTNQGFVEMVEVAARNTWPKVEMIRCHCAVEMALEGCVQSMRRQLANENQARMIASAAHHLPFDSLRRRGRVPSFYTSRSLVNLSGLNVTDPSIVMLPQQPTVQDPSSLLASNPFESRTSLGGESTISEEGDVGLSMEVPLPFGVPLASENTQQKGSNSSISALMQGNDIPRPIDIMGMGGAAGVSGGEGGDHGLPQGGTSSADNLHFYGAADNMIKTTSMANFYYRRSNSMDAMKKLSTSNVSLSAMSDPSASIQQDHPLARTQRKGSALASPMASAAADSLAPNGYHFGLTNSITSDCHGTPAVVAVSPGQNHCSDSSTNFHVKGTSSHQEQLHMSSTAAGGSRAAGAGCRASKGAAAGGGGGQQGAGEDSGCRDPDA